MKASAAFEQQVRRIYELIAESGAEVTWNDHIGDPDNSPRTRQIDVTLRRNGELTLVECRLRKAPQDVQWIECLIGRRISLGAQSVIAVSSSGFTSGALAKARQYGCRLSSISIVAAFQAKFIFNVYSDFAVINYSPLKIRYFFGFAAMPRTMRRRVLPVLRSEDPKQTPSFRHPVQFAFVHAKAVFSPTIQVKEKLGVTILIKAKHRRRE
jgi:hypothetical protein